MFSEQGIVFICLFIYYILSVWKNKPSFHPRSQSYSNPMIIHLVRVLCVIHSQIVITKCCKWISWRDLNKIMSLGHVFGHKNAVRKNLSAHACRNQCSPDARFTLLLYFIYIQCIYIIKVQKQTCIMCVNSSAYSVLN